jgi:hypothetical protein
LDSILVGGNGNSGSQLSRDDGGTHLLAVGAFSNGMVYADFLWHWVLNSVIFICFL